MTETVPPEALLESYPPRMRAVAEHLRTLVRAAAPEVVERVRWGWHLVGYDLPVGRRSAYFAYIAPEELHVHLGFEHGWLMDDPDRHLQGAGVTRQVRWLTFTDPDEVDASAVVPLVHEAARIARLSRAEREVLREERRTG